MNSLHKTESLITKGKLDEAEKLVNLVLQDDSENSIAYYFKALIYKDRKKVDVALNYLDNALAIEPDNADYLFMKSLWLMNIEKFSEAVETLTRLLAVEKEQNSDYSTDIASFFRALASIRLNDLPQARKDLINVPGDFETYILGRLYSKNELLSYV